jgi:hypothetical protein
MLTRRSIEEKFPGLNRLLKTACNNRPDDYLAKRVDLQALISANSERGQVVILESGMDCDCVAFSNRKYKVDALPVAVRALMDRIYGDAEGPCHLSIVSPSAAKRLEYGSRDLGMEAYENGHPSRVSYSL